MSSSIPGGTTSMPSAIDEIPRLPAKCFFVCSHHAFRASFETNSPKRTRLILNAIFKLRKCKIHLFLKKYF